MGGWGRCGSLVSCLSVQVLKVLNSRSTVRELSLKDLYHNTLLYSSSHVLLYSLFNSVCVHVCVLCASACVCVHVHVCARVCSGVSSLSVLAPGCWCYTLNSCNKTIIYCCLQ